MCGLNPSSSMPMQSLALTHKVYPCRLTQLLLHLLYTRLAGRQPLNWSFGEMMVTTKSRHLLQLPIWARVGRWARALVHPLSDVPTCTCTIKSLLGWNNEVDMMCIIIYRCLCCVYKNDCALLNSSNRVYSILKIYKAKWISHTTYKSITNHSSHPHCHNYVTLAAAPQPDRAWQRTLL